VPASTALPLSCCPARGIPSGHQPSNPFETPTNQRTYVAQRLHFVLPASPGSPKCAWVIGNPFYSLSRRVPFSHRRCSAISPTGRTVAVVSNPASRAEGRVRRWSLRVVEQDKRQAGRAPPSIDRCRVAIRSRHLLAATVMDISAGLPMAKREIGTIRLIVSTTETATRATPTPTAHETPTGATTARGFDRDTRKVTGKRRGNRGFFRPSTFSISPV